jgi:D-glycero-D-manno-heptose 1,7-bisphosphate phosphatase
MVGDRWRDVEAGRAAGCTTVWLRNDYDERRSPADAEFDSLAEAASWIIGRAARSDSAE